MVTRCSDSSGGTGLDYIGLRVIERLTLKDVTCYLCHGFVYVWGCVHLYSLPV